MMVSRPLLIGYVVVPLLLAAPARAQEPPAPSAAHATPGAVGTSFVVEQEQLHVRFENDGTGTRELTFQIHLLDQQAVQRFGEIPLAYAPDTEDLTLERLTVERPDGSVAASAPGNVQDLAVRPYQQLPIFVDLHQKVITVPALQPGDTIRMAARWTIKHPLTPGQFWFEYSFDHDTVIRDNELVIDVPADRAVTLKTAPDGPSEQGGGAGTLEGARRVYRWKTSNAAPLTDDQQRALLNRTELPEADVRLTSYRDWDDLAQWFRGLAPASIDPAVRQKAAELTKGLTDRQKKIDAIYDYVSKSVRYVGLSFGLGRYAPHAPAEVLKNQYGDCKDKATLLASLLRAAGIESTPVLLYTNRSIDDGLPSPLAFDHEIIVIADGTDPSSWTWMDTTAEVAPIGMLPSQIRGKRALFLGSRTEKSRLIRTPADPPMPSIDTIQVDGRVNGIGVLAAHVAVSSRGDAALGLRAIVRLLPHDKLSEFGKQLASAEGIPGEVSDVSTSDPTDTGGPFQVTFQVRDADYLDWAKETSTIKPLATATFPDAKEEDRRDKDLIDLGSPKTLHLKGSVELPAGYVPQAPVPVKTSNDTFDYTSAYGVEGTRLTWDRTLVSHGGTIPSARFGAYAATIRAVQADFDQTATVHATVGPTPAIPADATSTELYDAAFNAYEAERYDAAAALWKRDTEIDPKKGDAWISMGLAYDKLHRYGEAAAAIQKQIDLDPYNKSAYSDLGSVLKDGGKFEAAAKAYARHLELNPLDGSAMSALGEIDNDLERYADAAAVLTKAATLIKDNAWIFDWLGLAQAHLKQMAEARKSFDRAIEISPTVPIWTHAAWQMAETGLDLDRAADLATRSEQQIAEDTRALTLKSLDENQLDRMNRLSWDWDALGWVQLQKGNTSLALAYVRAAWLLGGHPGTALHLGEIDEKQKHLADALSYYVTAEAVSDSPTDAMRAHVKHLAEGGDLTMMLASAKRHAVQDRLVPVKAHMPDGRAHFLVVVDRDHTVREVRFSSGDDALRPLEAELMHTKFPVEFPDAVVPRLVLGVDVGCVAPHGCEAMVQYPNDVELPDAPATGAGSGSKP
ncbi:MAG TPA: DUF3857 domain-containing protein [Vicinamibacterales bacterium]|nr:DUF3857 domain-containing protein [Vicinamibacterales bacterium]